MLYFSRGSFGSNFDLAGWPEAVANEARRVRQVRRFAVEVVEDFIEWLER